MSDLLNSGAVMPAPLAKSPEFEAPKMLRKDLISACCEKYRDMLQGLPGNPVMSCGNEALQLWLDTGEMPTKIRAMVGPGPVQVESPGEDNQADAMRKMFEAIQAVARQTTPDKPVQAEVSADMVREIVQEELSRHAKHVHVITPEGKVIDVGLQHKRFNRVLQLVSARKHVYLVGPAGTGKTTMAEKCAVALELPFVLQPFGPTTPESRLVGSITATGEFRESAFLKCYREGGIYCADEVDNAAPEIVTVLNGSLANGYMLTASGEMVKRHKDFVLIACANTWGTGATREFANRAELDRATLDRFFQVHIDYDTQFETAIALSLAGNKRGEMFAQAFVNLIHAARVQDQEEVLTGTTSRTIFESIEFLLLTAPGEETVKVHDLLREVLNMRLWRGTPEIAVNRLKTQLAKEIAEAIKALEVFSSVMRASAGLNEGSAE